MNVKFNVAGHPVQIQADTSKLLWRAMNQAFAAAGLTGEPWENWELRDEDGRLLDREVVLAEFDLGPDATIYLNRKAGIGG